MIEQSTILAKTRDYINQYVGDTTDDFTEETDSLLKSFIDAAAQMVAQVAPGWSMEMCTAAPATTWSVRPDGNYYGTFALPDYFMRLERLTLKDGTEMLTKQPVTALLPVSDSSYQQQFSCIPGLGAGMYKPKAYRIDEQVELHSVPGSKSAGGTPELCYYEKPYVNTDDDGKTGYPLLNSELTDTIAMQAASLYMGVTGDPNAQVCQQAAGQMMQMLIAGKMPAGYAAGRAATEPAR